MTTTRYTAIISKNPNFFGDLDAARNSLTNASVDERVDVAEARTLDDVFAMLNHGSGREMPGYCGRSLSVGMAISLRIDQCPRFALCQPNAHASSSTRPSESETPLSISQNCSSSADAALTPRANAMRPSCCAR